MTTLDLATLRVILTADNSKYQAGIGQAKASTTGFGDATKAVLTGIVVAGFAAAGAAAVQFANQSIAEFKNFESSMSEVFTLLPGLSSVAMGAMQDDVLAFAASTGRVSDEVVPALYQALSAGIPAENVFDFLQLASDAALGGVTTLEVAVDGITSAVNAYGSETLAAKDASDLMFAAVLGGKTTFEELASSLFNVLPVAASLGVEFGNVTAALATMTSAGVPTSVATTQLRQLLVELSQAGGDAAQKFEQMAGVSFPAFIAAGGNLQQALQMMEQAAANSGVRLSDLFGSVEAGNAALGLTGASAQKFSDELDRAASASGMTADAAEIMNDTLAMTEARADAATEKLKIMIGEALAPGREAAIGFKAALAESVVSFLAAASAETTVTIGAQEMAGAMAAAAEFGTGLSEELLNLSDSGQLTAQAVDLISQAYGQGGGAIENYTATSEALGRAITVLADGFDGTAGELAALVTEYEQARPAAADYMAAVAGQGIILADTATAMDAYVSSLTSQNAALLLVPSAAEAAADVLAAMAGGERELSFTTEAAVAAGASQATTFREQKAAAEAAETALLGMTAATGDYFTQASQATGKTTDWNGILYEAVDASGAGAAALALLGVATGEFTQAEAEAYLKTAILRAEVEVLAAEYANGNISLQELMDRFGQAQGDIENLGVAFSTSQAGVILYNDALGELDGTLDGLTGSAAAAKAEVEGVGTAAHNAAGDYDITIHVAVTGDPDPIPDIPDNAGNPGQPMASGGFTGWGAVDEVAGIVHGQEYVFSAPAVAAIGLPVLEAMHNSGAVPSGNSYQINVDARGAGPGAATDIERAIRRILRDEVGAAERRQR